MGYRLENPRKDEYTLYIATKNTSGIYSEPEEVTIQHPGIQKLNLQEHNITPLISSIQIKFPQVFSESSQTVFPEDNNSEEKDILGYRLHVQEVDLETEQPIGNEEVIDYPVNDDGLQSRTVYYQNETNKKFKIRVGAYDSVYHPD